MKKLLLPFIVMLTVNNALIGCASIQNFDFSQEVDYEDLLKYDEQDVLRQYDDNKQTRIINSKVIAGYDKTLVFHVVCVNEKCVKDNKYFVYEYEIDGRISDPEKVHESYNHRFNKIQLLEKRVVSKEGLSEFNKKIEDTEKAIEIENQKQQKRNAEIARKNAKIESENQRKREQYMATAKYPPQIQIRRKVDYNCGMSCYATTMKEVTSTDNVPFRVHSVTVNGRCNLIRPSNLLMNLGDSFNILEIDAPHPVGCGRILKVTLKTNRGTFDYDLR